MKTVLHALLLSTAIFLSHSSLTAQISISASDIGAYYNIGNSISQQAVVERAMYDIGAPGGGNNWDFSGIIADSIATGTVLDPADTPFAEDFSAANRVTFTEFEEDGVSASQYFYVNLGTDELVSLGFAGSSEFDGLMADTKSTYSPTQPTFSFPIELEATWSYEGVQMIETSFDGGSFTQQFEVSRTSEVDAYGTLILPNEISADALRIKEVTTTSSEIVPGFPFVSQSVSFVFVTKNGNFLSVSTDFEEVAPVEGTIEGSLSWSTSANISSTVDLEAQGFELHPPLTHPVSNSSLINYSLPNAENIRLSLFDMNGREVKVLASGQQPAGAHRLNFERAELSGGVYFLSLQAKGGIMTQKVIINP